MVRGRARPRKNIEEESESLQDDYKTEYEESRAQRIRENAERMKSLGILELSKKLKPITKPKPKPKPSWKKPKSVLSPSNDPPRRSSRLKDMPIVSYSEKSSTPKTDKNVNIRIPRGSKPEIYTEEHEKLLGDCKAAWSLHVDGFDEDRQRIYDPFQGKSCHQCRQKTLGHRTECSKCRKITGQFCGDCLYVRYGENVIEVNQNPDWVCPVCRGICNCSRCRREKGWAPTGAIHWKVKKLGFKSVAHYLIQTYHGQTALEMAAAENSIPVVESSSDDDREEHSGALSSPLSDSNCNGIEGSLRMESAQEYGGESCEDNGNDGTENAD